MDVTARSRSRLTIGAGLAGIAALVLSAAPEPPPRDTARAAEAPSAQTVSLTVTEGTNLAVTASGDGESIVIDLHGFLYKLAVSGGPAERISDVRLDPARPAYAPDGTRVAVQSFAEPDGGFFHISTVSADGGDVQQLTDGQYDHREPRWSPDGAHIVFASDRPNGEPRQSPADVRGSYDIWSIDVATGELTQWTDTPMAEEFEPAWSPDGNEVAFVVSNSIQAVDREGNRRTLVAQRPGVTLNSPAWSPDGQDVAYVARSGGQSNLMVSDRQVTSGQDVFVFSTPEWLSGSEVLYAADGGVRVIDVDSGDVREVPFSATLELPELTYEKKSYDFDSTSPRPVQGIVTPTLNPDGRTFAFTALNDLWVGQIGGNPNPRRITNDTYYEVDPAWSRDGRYLAYSSDKGGTQDIYVYDMRTGTERRVTALEDEAAVSAAWSPDGRTIAFQNQDYATFTVDVESGDIREVIGALFGPGRPTWSADGNTIALTARMRYSTRFREGHNQILTVDLTTGEQAYHPPGEEFDTISTRADDGPVWSPDGRWMAFVVASTLRVMPVDERGRPTGPPVQITDEATDAPTWSGDSEWLLYLNNGRLKLVRRDGSETREVPFRLTYRPHQARGRTVIHAGRFWDGTSPEVQRNVDIVVVNNRIRSVSPHRRPIAGPHIDASDLTVIPGLWDTHFHREREIRFFADRTGRAALAFGLTSTLAPGDAAYRSVENREATLAGTRVGPRGFASGEALDGSRTHLNYFRPITSLEQVTVEMSRARELEYDYVKSYVRPGVDTMAAIAEVSHQMGVPVGTHLMAPGFYVGQDITTHLGATQRLGYARTMSQTSASYSDVTASYSQRAVSTTIGPNRFLWPLDCDNDPRAQLVPVWKPLNCGPEPPDDPDCATGTCRQAQPFARIRDAGGLVLAGTDFPLGGDVPFTLHAELRALVRYGWTPYEALVTATRKPPEFIGIADDLGTLEPGKLADMVFVEGNPLERIEDATNTVMVMQNGVLFTPEEILEEFFAGPSSSDARPGQAAKPTHRRLPPVPDHPNNEAFWWHDPAQVRLDHLMTES